MSNITDRRENSRHPRGLLSMTPSTDTRVSAELYDALVELLRTTANQAIYCSSDHAKARETAKALLAALTKARAAS
jgi:hypothetical protein